MKNKKYLVRLLCLIFVTSSSVWANSAPHSGAVKGALHFWEERSIKPASLRTLGSYGSGYQASEQIPQAIPASYQKPDFADQPLNRLGTKTGRHAVSCHNVSAYNLPDSCILNSSANRRGLLEQIRFLKRKDLHKRVANNWAKVSNAALLQTAKELISWQERLTPYAFRERFSLREVGSQRGGGHGHYTGYYTPVLQVKARPDAEYRYPIYGRPKYGSRPSRQQIDHGALRNQGLEIAWTNDRVNLYFAQIQGSAIARYPSGLERYLGYAGNNGRQHVAISQYLRKENIHIPGGLSNKNIRNWLHANPHKIDKILHKNPRYIFFSLSDAQPRTATGATVIPGHTVAVDEHYIPLGSVLLAEIPRIDHQGERVGSDWRLLFAQDRGSAIKGPGRLDIFAGFGTGAERHTYRLTGLHRTYLLVRKPGFLGQSVAGL